MPELQEPLPGDEVDATWGEQVSNRVVSRYASIVQRDAGGPFEEGTPAYIIDIDEFQVYDGAAWIVYVDRAEVAAEYLPLTGGTLTGILTAPQLSSEGRILRAPAQGDVLVRWNGDSDADSGRYFEWRRGPFGTLELYGIEGMTPNLMGILRAGGSSDWKQLRVMASNDGFGNLSVENMSTTGQAANMHYTLGDGRLRYNTSARKYKTNIKPLPKKLAKAKLEPVSYKHKGDGAEYLGFIAEDIAAVDARAGVYNEAGEVENYDLRGVVAILAAQVNDLKAQVAALSS